MPALLGVSCEAPVRSLRLNFTPEPDNVSKPSTLNPQLEKKGQTEPQILSSKPGLELFPRLLRGPGDVLFGGSD